MIPNDEVKLSASDETMKQVGILEEATRALIETQHESHLDREATQDWVSFLVQTLLSIFKKP